MIPHPWLLLCILLVLSCSGTKKTIRPTPGQQAMIDRKYGMFLHYGMNTYLDKEWSDGTTPASTFNPPEEMAAKIENWVTTAKNAGMRSIVLPVKHHDGFCLWNTQYTDYSTAHPAILHPIDVVKTLSDACHKHGITFSIYYSLWDRHDPSYKKEDPHEYIVFMKNQLQELMTQYGEIGELWLDGVWDRKNEKWYLQEIYDFVKSMQPQCQISTNWTLNKRPIDMHEGDSIVYFPADFRLWDPYLPMANDPKIYSHHGEKYYLPFECTQTISVLGNWFYHPQDTLFRNVDDLEEIFFKATRNDNCLLLNVPPDGNGNFHPKAVEQIIKLAERLNIKGGKPFPKKLKQPHSLMSDVTTSVSSVYKNDSLHYGAYCLTDGDVSTSWKCNEKKGWFVMDLGRPCTFQQVQLIEQANYIKNYTLEITDGPDDNLKIVHSGTALSNPELSSFMGYGYGEIHLSKPVNARKIRFTIQTATNTPAIYSVRLK